MNKFLESENKEILEKQKNCDWEWSKLQSLLKQEKLLYRQGDKKKY